MTETINLPNFEKDIEFIIQDAFKKSVHTIDNNCEDSDKSWNEIDRYLGKNFTITYNCCVSPCIKNVSKNIDVYSCAVINNITVYSLKNTLNNVMMFIFYRNKFPVCLRAEISIIHNIEQTILYFVSDLTL
jgi:hypothetical protein